MIHNVNTAKVGDKVFLFNSWSTFPSVTDVIHATDNFVDVRTGQTKTRFRRDGSAVEKHCRDSIKSIEPGDIENFEKEKSDKKRIQEIIEFLNSKGFKFNGYPQWYSVEQWEKIFAAFAWK